MAQKSIYHYRVFGFTAIFLLMACSPGESQRAKVDMLITSGTILTMNARGDVIRNGVVVIDDGLIVDIGQAELVNRYSSPQTLDVADAIVLPGLVNTHTHLSMTVFRSLGEDTANRLHKFLLPLEALYVDKEMVSVGAELGALESIKGGSTTVVDMYYYEEEVASALDRAGLRGIVGQTIMATTTPDAATPTEGMARALALIDDYRNHDRIIPAFAPHAPYTNSSETLQEIAKLAKEHAVPILIHLAESEREESVVRERSGRTPVQYLDSINVLSERLLAAHVIRVNTEDIELLQRAGVGVAHNMSANIKSAKGVAPVPAMLEQELRVGLGTDGPMSGNGLSVVEELNQVAKLHKLWSNNREAMPAKRVVELATIGGARALHMDDRIGSLERGKLADIIVVSTSAPHMTPIYDEYAALVYSALPSDVLHSIVNGVLIMRDRNVLTMSEEKVKKSVGQFANRVRQSIRSFDAGEPLE